MVKKDDGGPAHPAPDAARARFGESNPDAFMGMSLRDYFAAKAMQGFASGVGDMCLEDIEKSIPISAKLAYAMADTMIAERAK